MGFREIKYFICAAFVVLSLLLAAGASLALHSGRPDTSLEPKLIPNQLLIKFKDAPMLPVSGTGIMSVGPGSDVIADLNKKYGVANVENISKQVLNGSINIASGTASAGIYKITLSRDVDISSVAAEASLDPGVEWAEPNGLMRICVVPNDPYFYRQWGLAKIKAAEGWDSEVGCPAIVIAVIDTGVDYNHPDLSANIWRNPGEIPGNGIDDDGNGYIDDHRGWDFVSVPPSWVAVGEDPGPPDNDPYDFVGHGTHVSGIAAGHTNNGLGAAGTSWNCKIMPLRAGYAASDGYGYLEFTDAAEALRYAADNGADVINMSWGSTYDSAIIRDAIDYARNKGCVMVASAGNVTSSFAERLYYPASYDGVISVASTDEDDKLSIWSWDVFSNFGEWVDVSAPGTYIYSTLPGASYGYYSGTSMASPYVAGLAALIKVKNPSFSSVQIEEKIKDSADNIDYNNPSFLAGKLGAGRINAFAALGRLKAKIVYPKRGSVVGMSVAIEGSASIDNFKEYTLEWGKGESPSVWNTIYSRSEPVENGALGSFKAEDGFGDYTIKLTVHDTKGSSYEAYTTVNVSPNSEVELSGQTLFGPNPYNPRASETGLIQFKLGSIPGGFASVDIGIYDITGKLIWKKVEIVEGDEVNDNQHVEWDGRNLFGEIVGNGVYPYLLVASANGSKKVIGRGKIAVIH